MVRRHIGLFRNQRMKRCRYGFYIRSTGSDLICTECDYGADRDSDVTENENETDRTCGGGGVSSTEGGDADHGRRDDSGFYCSYLPLLCKGLSEDYSDLVRNAWVWTDRISG